MKDQETAASVTELDRSPSSMSLRERLAAFYAAKPLPPPTGLIADKAFFDELSGET